MSILEPSIEIYKNTSFVPYFIHNVKIEEEFISSNEVHYFSYSYNGVMIPYSFYSEDFYSSFAPTGLLTFDDIKNNNIFLPENKRTFLNFLTSIF